MRVVELTSDTLRARVLDYGATLMSLEAPDREGRLADVVLGFDEPERYRGTHPYFGAIVGRYANRIAHGRFALDGATYRLACNNGRHHLHGGTEGFSRKIWEAERSTDAVTFRYTSPDGEEGYPGTVTASVRYGLQGSVLTIDYEATTDRATVINLTNHAYFNLAGAGIIDAHELRIDAERFVEVDAERIPTGTLAPVAGTPFDWRERRPIGATQVDHSFVLSGGAELCHPQSGRVLRIRTTQPGVQLYTGDLLDGSIVGKRSQRYVARSGVCLEPQHFPDSPNRPHFPSGVLRPGQRYRHGASYEFATVR